jgi:hypothetical protein
MRKDKMARLAAERAEKGRVFEGVLGARGKAAESTAAEGRLTKELTSREAIESANRQSRETIEGANRQSRETIASLPKEKEQAAQTIFDEAAAAGMPITMEQAMSRATAALNPAPDRYNALSNRLTAANKEISALRTINEYALYGEKDPKKKETIKNDFETKRQAILRNYAISEADLIELNTAGRSLATGASATQGQPPAQPPAQPKATSNQIPVTAPNGQTFYFPTQQAADKFKRQIAGEK